MFAHASFSHSFLLLKQYNRLIIKPDIFFNKWEDSKDSWGDSFTTFRICFNDRNLFLWSFLCNAAEWKSSSRLKPNTQVQI